MAWGFDADCPDCGHHWEGVQASFCVGPAVRSAALSWYLFCPSCYKQLYLPRSLERKAWRVWYERFLESPSRPKWVMRLLARIDAAYASAGWFTPLPIEPGAIDCPGCGLPMVPGVPGGDHVACPACGSQSPLLSPGISHVSLVVMEDGFT